MNQAEVASLAEPQAAPAPAAPDLLAGARYAAPLQSGARLQEFEISTVIGQGGFGIVYLARDLSLQRSVAIKEYFPAHLAGRDLEGHVRALTPGQADVLELGRRSFINEARMLARFKHTGLVEVLRFWEQNGTAYMAMPFYDGATLTQYLKRHPGVATEAWLRKTLKPLVDALGHMHQEDCFHRDVAPDNILILKDGSAVLLDLGAARRVIANDAQAMTVMLKPGYAPIEQYSDDPRFRQGPWTDIYAMAAVFFFAVTGKAPPASASRVMRDSVSPLCSVRPEGFSESFLLAIDKGLSLQPEDRPRSIAEFGALLYASPEQPDAKARLKSARAGAADGDQTLRGASGDAQHLSTGAADGPQDGDTAAVPARPLAVKPAGVAAAGIGLLLLVFAAVWFSLRPGPSPDRMDAPALETSAETARTSTAAATGSDLAPDPAVSPAVPPRDVGKGTTARASPDDATDAAPEAAQKPAAAPKLAAAPKPAAAQRNAATQPAPAPKPAANPQGEGKAAAIGNGTVTLAVKPWAEIRVNGVAKGISPPLKQLTLPAGRHTIELRNSAAAAPVKQQVEVRANQQTVLSHQF